MPPATMRPEAADVMILSIRFSSCFKKGGARRPARAQRLLPIRVNTVAFGHLRHEVTESGEQIRGGGDELSVCGLAMIRRQVGNEPLARRLLHGKHGAVFRCARIPRAGRVGAHERLPLEAKPMATTKSTRMMTKPRPPLM